LLEIILIFRFITDGLNAIISVLDPGELVAGCYLTSEPVNVEPLNPARTPEA
jgi:hypothetical protein